MIRRTMLLGAAMLITAAPAYGEAVPDKGRFDARMKTVTYNRDDVIRVIGHYGYSTDIELAQGETVQDIALGDSLAWEIAPSANHLFVKPREDNAVTNMTVITDRRVYQFALDARQSQSPRDRSMYFQIRLLYPDDKLAQAKAEQEKRAAEAYARRVESSFRTASLPLNWNYYACGTREIRPVEVYDDGRFTYLRFPGAQEIPSVFMINADGSESIVNGAMNGDRYVIQITARKLVLRKGKAVACLENRSYNPYGVNTPTGTVSPDVERVLNVPAKRSPVLLPAPDTERTPSQTTPRPLHIQGITPEPTAGDKHVP
ncbi:P-type conjugative transfer protein VirB9 [Dyella sp.]|uniref:P-type conjugative transfer protein VirB9 n=1 Tax=Dyella sp. TaxID=1869338 RepID=UPI002ECFCD79